MKRLSQHSAGSLNRSLFLAISLAVTLLSACATDSGVPTVAKQHYREHIWYNVRTRPDYYYDDLPRQVGALRILAVGDSWFAYPKQFLFFDFLFGGRSNILTNLVDPRYSPPMTILSLSNSGELIANMAGLEPTDEEERAAYEQRDVSIPNAIQIAMKVASDKNAPFDYILISGGGNDLLIPTRVKNILNNRPCPDHLEIIDDCVNKDRLREYLQRVGVAYDRLAQMASGRRDYGCVKIVTHTYDTIIPSPIGADFLGNLVRLQRGGWLYPVLQELQVFDATRKQRFVEYVFSEFQETVRRAALRNANLIVVETQGTLAAEARRRDNENSKFELPELWLNEIHPTPTGFGAFAALLRKAIDENMQHRCRGIERGIGLENHAPDR